ncbi:MAG: hypothetical protein COB26_05170 [Piscirickettsiaceae bacterium]|nr:MAG: hypothetical protein COB89_04285 [Piscirickettsiaceae bacterium]PCI69939.1 MAG: hypothetical protein COB26_05170 [Piscirickettsiaceae bacterium]
MSIKYFIPFILLAIMACPTFASNNAIYEKIGDMPIDEAFDSVYQELEQRNFYVIFEANIGKNISRFKEKWGDNYNKNNLGGIRSMVFCNGWYANKVSNADPSMLALCPLHLTVIERSGKAHILFVKPSFLGQDSPALPILKEIESTVIDAINTAME